MFPHSFLHNNKNIKKQHFFSISIRNTSQTNRLILLAMLPDFTQARDEMDFSVESETGRLINIANYANLTGYFVLAGLIFIGVLSVFLYIYDLKTATKRSGEIPFEEGGGYR
jgi:hypothetical protein